MTKNTVTIQGKEYGLRYDVEAYLSYFDYVAANQEVSVARADVMRAIYMSESYAKVNGGEALTMETLNRASVSELDELLKVSQAVIKSDSEQTVKTKKAESAARRA